MSNENPSLAGIESTADRLKEALHKASDELSSSIKSAIEHLSAYNIDLKKSLTNQLKQLTKQLIGLVEEHQDELENYQEKLLDRLAEFERIQIETLTTTATSARDALSKHVSQEQEKILQTIFAEIRELAQLQDIPERELSQLADQAPISYQEITTASKGKIDTTAIAGEEKVSGQVNDLEAELQKFVEEWKQTIEQRIENSQHDFHNTASQIVIELAVLARQSLEGLEQKSQEGSQDILRAVEAATEKASFPFAQWQEKVNNVNDSFHDFLIQQRTSSVGNNQAELESRLTKAKEEISCLSLEAKEKIEASHKTLESSLKRLEKDYQRQLDQLILHYESTISEYLRQSKTASNVQERINQELKEKIREQISTEGKETLKAVIKLAQQLEGDYLKSSQSLDEVIDYICTQASDQLDKHVQQMKGDIKKISKRFQDGLSELESDVEDIELAGKKAAETVMTYRNALMSLESE